MKKIVAALLICTMLFSLVGCGSSTQQTATTQEVATSGEAAGADAVEDEVAYGNYPICFSPSTLTNEYFTV